MSDQHEADIDELATRAGRELRRSAPAGGLDRVHRSHRRRRATNAVVAGAALVVLAGGVLVAVNRGDDAVTVVTDTVVTDTTPATINSAPAPANTVATDSLPTAPTTEATVDVEPAISDERLPDPLTIAADGVERSLVGRELVVRTVPEQVIPLDLAETDLWLYGVGPNGVAYIRAEGDGLTRIVAVPTSGPTTGAVYELIRPYQHEGPWLGSMTPSGIATGDLFLNALGSYVDIDGQPLAQRVDSTFTWAVRYSTVEENPAMTRAIVVELATGAEFEVPDLETTREGQFDRELRPLPDGRVVVPALRDDGTALVWSLTPSTGLWTQHPAG